MLERYLFSSAVTSDWAFSVAVNIFFQHFIQCKDSSDSCFRSRRNLDSHHCGLYSVFTVVLATISQTILFHLIHSFAPFYLTVFFSPAPELHLSFILLLFQVFVHHPPNAVIRSLGVSIPLYKYKQTQKSLTWSTFITLLQWLFFGLLFQTKFSCIFLLLPFFQPFLY